MRRAPARPRGEQRERLPRAGARASRLPQDGAPHRRRVPHGGARPQVLRRPLLLLPAAALRRLRHAARAGLLHVLHGSDGRGQHIGPRAHRQCLHLPPRQAPRGVALCLLHGAARGLAAPALQPAGAAAGGAAAGDGARVAAYRRRVHGRRAGRLPRHVCLRHGRVPGGRVGRRVRAARRAPRQRAAQLQQHGVRRRPPHRHLRCSQCRRGLRCVRPVRGRAAVAARVVRGAPDGRAGGSHHWPARAQELRAEAARATHVVGGAGRVRRLHPLRRPLQRVQPGVRVNATGLTERAKWAGRAPRIVADASHSGNGPARHRRGRRKPAAGRPGEESAGAAKTEDDVRHRTARGAGGGNRNNGDHHDACRQARTSMLVRGVRGRGGAMAAAGSRTCDEESYYYSGCLIRTSVSSIF